jgi:two-component system, NtrC family, sensor histidine kinase HydH
MMRAIPSIERTETETFRSRQTAFSILTLFVLAILLVLHALFAPLLGEPSKAVILVLAFGFLLKVCETVWLQSRVEGATAKEAHLETAISIVGVFVLAGALAFFTDRDDAPYFVLLAIPILQCAYHCGLLPTIASIIAAVGMMFAWIHHYFSIHPPPRATEYLQAGMIAVIFCMTGPLVWLLVNQLKEREADLREKMRELEAAREKLVSEEKLAAVGRFASGIAHEIRNPVAMIASSLATAAHPASDSLEREEMFAIAARESRRLESLTTDFLTYARPSAPQRSLVSIGDIVHHIADVTRMRAANRLIDVSCKTEEDLVVSLDGAQIEGALLNLSLNALDATPSGGHVEIRMRRDECSVYLDVENSGKMIPHSNIARIFEPFFTTKPNGSGLGLAIARGIAVAHGGDLWISTNRDGAIVFTMTVPTSSQGTLGGEASNGEDSDS